MRNIECQFSNQPLLYGPCTVWSNFKILQKKQLLQNLFFDQNLPKPNFQLGGNFSHIPSLKINLIFCEITPSSLS